jgi:succinate dehydrogenase / fumarate reductase cytochrome b subunit
MNLVLQFWRSQIGKKAVMAVTGLIGVGFVVGHMLGNLQMFQGAEKMNSYAHFLKSLGGLLWLARAVLLGAVILHIVAAFQLSRGRLSARPVGYKRGSQREVSTFASKTIRWGGVLLLVFIVFHILHFTTLDIFRDYSTTDVYANVVHGFSKWWVSLFYVLAMAFLGLHLYHGVWSSMRTIGAVKPSPRPLRRQAALVLAIIVWAGFTAIPLGVLAGVIGPESWTDPAAVPASTGISATVEK